MARDVAQVVMATQQFGAIALTVVDLAALVVKQLVQFQQVLRLSREGRQRLALRRLQGTCGIVEHAQRADRVAVRAQDRRAGVETDVLATDQRIAGEARVGTHVVDFHHAFGLADGVVADGIAACGLAAIQPDARLEPLAIAVDQGDGGTTGAANGAGQFDQVIEGLFAAGVEDAVAIERSLPALLIGLRAPVLHASTCGSHHRSLAIPP